ncbi:uncharacterized protein LOC125371595 [Haliotis rufescens]|uniref:uncharacterized protein LOC125371595 n=1 Tax=Haliotis rufescens TaxID=6454 RepID=UPI00201F725B|nr:uncharacterized protein LOC125371595 [Haliotis rufescens]
MAEPDGITERDGSRPDDGNQTQTVLYRRTSDETVMASMRVTDQLILDGATASEHGRTASEQKIGPPQITHPGAHPDRLNITDDTDNVIVATGTSHGAVEDIPDMVREKMKSAKDIFVKTTAYENVYDALENVGHVLISGSPGSGKTTMALYIMGRYRKKKYNVKFIDDVAGFKVELYVNLKVPTLLVLDDVFGRFAPTSEVKVRCTKIFDYLETHFKRLEEKRRKTQDEDKTKGDEASGTPEISLKIIMSSRTNICKHQIVTTMLNKYKTSLFRQSTIAELKISELKEHEKESILRKHLVKSRLDLTEHDIHQYTIGI